MNDFVVKQGIQLGGSVKGNAKSVALSVNGYDLGVAAYDGVSFSVAAQDTGPRDLFFKPDGLVVYMLGLGNDAVYQYNLSTAWNISTASYLQTFSVVNEDTLPVSLFFKPDGTKLYVLGGQGADVNEYTLSTAWDISTASYAQNFSIAAQDTQPRGIFFRGDGTKMYITASVGVDVNEYTLSTAWDISTASYVQNFVISPQDTDPQGLFFKVDGTKMYVVGAIGDEVNEYNLSTAWDISTASYSGVTFSVASQDSNPIGLSFKDDGTKMYVIGESSDTVYQYTTGTFTSLDLSTADAFEVTPTADVTLGFSNPPAAGNAQAFSVALTGADVGASYDIANASYDSVSFDVSAQENVLPTGVFFKPEGNKMFIIGLGSASIHEYNLSTNWDTSTASFVQSFSISGQEAFPRGLYFKPDGLKVYIVGNSSDSVHEYVLSTAWDISTASFSQSEDVSFEDATPVGIFFKPDGSKMYVVGLTGVDVNEYNLSTAWDISTASYVQNFSVSAQDTGPRGIFFKPDGSNMYVVGLTGVDVNEYTLSVPWDILSSSFVQSFSVASQDSSPQNVFFKSDGTKMYIVGGANLRVFQYSTGTGPDIATFTYPASVKFPNGTPPTAPAVGETDVLTFYTDDGGTTYSGFQAGDAMQ